MTDLEKIEAVFKNGQLNIIEIRNSLTLMYCSGLKCSNCIAAEKGIIDIDECTGRISKRNLEEFYNKFPEARLV